MSAPQRPELEAEAESLLSDVFNVMTPVLAVIRSHKEPDIPLDLRVIDTFIQQVFHQQFKGEEERQKALLFGLERSRADAISALNKVFDRLKDQIVPPSGNSHTDH